MIYILAWIAAVLATLIGLRFLLRFPEIALALFVAAYVLKGGINVGLLNLTVIMLIIAILGFVLPVLAGKKRVQFRVTRADVWLWLFMIVLIAGILYSPSPTRGIEKAFRILAMTVVPYFLVRMFLKNQQQVKRFLITLFMSAFLISIVFVFGMRGTSVEYGRMMFLDANPIAEASLLAMGFLIAVIGAAEGLFQKRWMRWFSLGSAPILIYGLLLTGSRAPLVSAAVGMAFYSAIVFRRRAGRVLGVGLILIVLLTAAINMGALRHFPSARYNPLIWGGEASVIQRQTLYRSLWQVVQQYPLAGRGTGTVRIAENVFLEVLANVGIIGLLCFVAFLYSIAKQSVRYLVRSYPNESKVGRGIGVLAIAVALALFVDKQVGYSLDGDKDLFIFLGLVANLPYVLKLYTSNSNTKRKAIQGLR